MAQYIDKSALVAEIKRRRDESWLGTYTKEKGIIFDITDDILSFINTLEVREVDLDREITQFLDTYFPNVGIGHKLSLRRTAKHFFELGAKAQTKNIWNDASEELPVIYRPVLLYTEEGVVTQGRHDGGAWVLDMWVPKFPKILKWCYLSDIIST